MANEEFNINLSIANIAQIRQELNNLNIKLDLGSSPEFKALENWSKNGLDIKVNLKFGDQFEKLLALQKNGLNIGQSAGVGFSPSGGGVLLPTSFQSDQKALAEATKALETEMKKLSGMVNGVPVGSSNRIYPSLSAAGQQSFDRARTQEANYYGKIAYGNRVAENFFERDKAKELADAKAEAMYYGNMLRANQRAQSIFSKAGGAGNFFAGNNPQLQGQFSPFVNGVPLGASSSIYPNLSARGLAAFAPPKPPGGGGGGGNNGGGFNIPGVQFNRNPATVQTGLGTFTSGNIGVDAGLYALEKIKAGIFALIDPLKEASEAAYKFEASIVATVGTLQATTRIVSPNGLPVDPGVQLREQFRIATGLEKAGRGSLAPIGVGGAEQSLLTNTFIQAQTTKTGVAVSEQDLKTTLPRIVAAIKVLAPNLGETREAKELRDIILNQRVGQITAGPGIRALAPDLAKARTAQEFEEATRPLEAYITALKEGNTPLAERLKLEGEFHIVQQDAGEAFNQALLPGLKAIEKVLEDPAISSGLQTFARNIGDFVTSILEQAARFTQNPLGGAIPVPSEDLGSGVNSVLKSKGIKGNVTVPYKEPSLIDLINAVPGAFDDYKNAFNSAISPAVPDLTGQFGQIAKARGLQQKPAAGPLKSEATPDSKFASLLSGLNIDKEKFDKTTSTDLANLGNDPNVQIFQGQQLKKAIPGLGLDETSANERSLGALRLIAGGQEKNQAIGDRNFASNLPGQIAKTQFDIKSFGDRISTQRQIVANRQEAIQNESDPLKKGILEGELRTEIDKLKEDLKGFGDSLKEAEAQPLKVAKAFSDLALTVQQLNHLPLRQAIARGAADDAVKAATRDRNNFIAEGPLRNIQRQSAVVSAAQRLGEAGGSLSFQAIKDLPGGFAGAAAVEAANRGLKSFTDALEAAKKAVDDFKDGFEERQDNRDTAVYDAQKALDAALNVSSGETGQDQDQHQRDIRAAQRALDKARQNQINGFSDDAKEEDKLKDNIPTFLSGYLNKAAATEGLAKEERTNKQGAEVDAEGLRGKNRTLATAALDKLELPLKQTNELLTLLNARLAQLQNLGLTPASQAAANAQDSASNDNTDTGIAGGIYEQQKQLNKLYGPKGKSAINGPPSPAETLSGAQERASIGAGLFAAVTGAEFEGTDGKTSAKGVQVASDIVGALDARDDNLKHFKKSAEKFKQSAFGDDNIFNTASDALKPLSKADTADAFYDAMNRHFN